MLQTIEAVTDYFTRPRPKFITVEQSICYIADRLLNGDSYGTQLKKDLTDQYPNVFLSDTNLYAAIYFLNRLNLTTSSFEKPGGRGRPRTMFSVNQENISQVTELSTYWQKDREQFGA